MSERNSCGTCEYYDYSASEDVCELTGEETDCSCVCPKWKAPIRQCRDCLHFTIPWHNSSSKCDLKKISYPSGDDTCDSWESDR